MGLLGTRYRWHEGGTVKRGKTADECSAHRRPQDRRYREKNRLALAWVKMHEPEVWAAIVKRVDES
jgi:hypothetical protein